LHGAASHMGGLPFDLEELRLPQPMVPRVHHHEYRMPEYYLTSIWSHSHHATGTAPRCLSVPTQPPCASSSCEACRHQRAAVCLVGSPRSFVRPHVYQSVAHRLIGKLGVQSDVFVATRLEDEDAKAQKTFNHSRWDATRPELVRALARLRPRAIMLDKGDSHETVYGVIYNPRCKAHGVIGRNRDLTMRSVAQPASWDACMDMIETAEKVDRVSYDWVIKTRMDLFWFAAHPHICSLTPNYVYMHIVESSPDHHFIIPRSAASTIMRMIDRYIYCDGDLPFDTVEDWLIHGALRNYSGIRGAMPHWPMPGCVMLAKEAPTTRPRNASGVVSTILGVTHLAFPGVLVRSSSKEHASDTDTDRFVRKVCYPYAALQGQMLPSSTSMCKAAFANESAEAHRLQRAFVRCMRDAYPNDDIADDSHFSTNLIWWASYAETQGCRGPREKAAIAR